MIVIDGYEIIATRFMKSFLLVSKNREKGFVIVPERNYIGPILHPSAILSRGYWKELTKNEEEIIDIKLLKKIYNKNELKPLASSM